MAGINFKNKKNTNLCYHVQWQAQNKGLKYKPSRPQNVQTHNKNPE